MSPRLPTLLLSLALVLLMFLPAAQAVPSSPEGLQAVVGRDYVDLSWQPVDDAEHYNVYRGSIDEMVVSHFGQEDD